MANYDDFQPFSQELWPKGTCFWLFLQSRSYFWTRNPWIFCSAVWFGWFGWEFRPRWKAGSKIFIFLPTTWSVLKILYLRCRWVCGVVWEIRCVGYSGWLVVHCSNALQVAFIHVFDLPILCSLHCGGHIVCGSMGSACKGNFNHVIRALSVDTISSHQTMVWNSGFAFHGMYDQKLHSLIPCQFVIICVLL